MTDPDGLAYEIAAQPRFLRGLLDRSSDIAAAARAFEERGCDHVHFVGLGSSYTPQRTASTSSACWPRVCRSRQPDGQNPGCDLRV